MMRRVLLVPVAGGVLAVAGQLADPFTLSSWNRILSLGLLAASVVVLTGFAGLPTLGQVAPYAVGAYTTALLARAGVVVGPVQLVAAVAAAGLFSALIAIVVVRARGLTFLMVTLAVAELTAIAAGQWRGLTGGSDGLAGIPATSPFWGAEPIVDDRAVYGYTLVVCTAFLAATWLILRSPAGLLVRGCRDDEARMLAGGHPVTRYLVITYIAAGALAGAGGALLITGQRYVSPQDVGFEVAALVLLAVTIGGTSSVIGAGVAVAFIVLLRDWAAVALPGHGPLLLGVLFVLAVYLLPGGLAGLRPTVARLRRTGPA